MGNTTKHPTVETGKHYGRWVAESPDPNPPRSRERYFICRCKCGTIRSVPQGRLLSGKSTSCGCFRTELIVARSTRHGFGGRGPSQAKEYAAWGSMIQRCTNSSNSNYPRYGGRGIRVCEGYRDFTILFADLGHRPSPGLSVDRIETNGHYSCGKCDQCKASGWPMNVRWATRKQQARNRRRNLLITFDNQTLTAAEWAEKTGIKSATIRDRLKNKWTVQEALTMPAIFGRRRPTLGPAAC